MDFWHCKYFLFTLFLLHTLKTFTFRRQQCLSNTPINKRLINITPGLAGRERQYEHTSWHGCFQSCCFFSPAKKKTNKLHERSKLLIIIFQTSLLSISQLGLSNQNENSLQAHANI